MVSLSFNPKHFSSDEGLYVKWFRLGCFGLSSSVQAWEVWGLQGGGKQRMKAAQATASNDPNYLEDLAGGIGHVAAFPKGS